MLYMRASYVFKYIFCWLIEGDWRIYMSQERVEIIHNFSPGRYQAIIWTNNLQWNTSYIDSQGNVF